ncbi:hypothetical protein [Sphingomonas sp.]|uniref:hypothetical protein n=1 Tax=Sphingomonas sp. TaxID=28214 RepID=UPI002EDA6B08
MIGAALGVIFQGALPWTQRILQFAVGLVVSHYAGGALLALFPDWPTIVQDAVKLGIGMSAFEGAKRFRLALIEVASRAPGDLWDHLKGLFGKKP